MMLSKVMSKKLITLEMDDPLEKAKKLFQENPIHHILVIDNDELVGVITDRDIFKHLSPTGGTAKETPSDISYLQKKVHLVMNRNLVTAQEDLPIKEAVLLFHDYHISCLPIVGLTGNPIGIITWRDIIKLIAMQYRQTQKNTTIKKEDK